ncbi:MAG TPA: hypothetical protein VE871_11005 [Longimicrobium sp.]|nr:hypothetical protein [Longimicrobium sp.]
MTKIPLRTVRFAFMLFLLALTAFAVVESAVGGPAPTVAEGLSTCGTADAPCALETVAVTIPAAESAPLQVAAGEGLSACGTEAEPCRLDAVEVNAPAAARLASVEHALGMTLRVRS